MPERKHYSALDGLRAFSALGIVAMHVLSNGNYAVSGAIAESIIPSFTNLVFLFMVISAFSMCCGYFEKIVSNQISLESFYSKRYGKIFPFFALLCLADFVLSPSLETLYELFANFTLGFGLIPNHKITIIGVGWFIGVVFVFYLLFPFICYLLSKKWRAWFSFAVSCVLTLIFTVYNFGASDAIDRSSFIYCVPFFIAGGLIYLYKEKLTSLSKRYWYIVLLLLLCLIAGYYFIPWKTAMCLILSVVAVVFAIGREHTGALINPITKFLSNISFEIYLCHMVVFRVLEKLKVLHLFSSEWLSYLLVMILTVGLSIGISLVGKYAINMIKILFQKVCKSKKQLSSENKE